MRLFYIFPLLFLALTPFLFLSEGDFENATAEVDRTHVFKDVDGDHLHKASIEFLYDMAIVDGNPDGTFAPARSLNRAELAKIAIQSLGETKSEKGDCFEDVPTGVWFAGYVCKAKELGIVRGDGGKGLTFRPGDTINVAEVLSILSKLYDWELGEGDTWFAPLFAAGTDKNILSQGLSPSLTVDRGTFAELMARSLVVKDLQLEKFQGDEDFTNYFKKFIRLREAIDPRS